MRDFESEVKSRVDFIKNILIESGAKGIVYGNSGGKDCTLASILCKMATENVLGVMMPCHSKANYTTDIEDAKAVSEQYNIKNITVDISSTKDALAKEILKNMEISKDAGSNVAPRLRMTTLYTIGASLGYLVCGTGNKSERHMGYFTKWGDGACDFNPIADLSATEVFEFLRYLKAPISIITKPPSAGLFEGQTDETEMGVTYKQIDEFLETGKTEEKAMEIINLYHSRSEHKRVMPKVYK